MELNRLIDHTLLRANAREKEIVHLCEEARKYNFFSVCIHTKWLDLCTHELKHSDTLPITVIGFPLGVASLKFKQKECEEALKLGAREIDMVIDLAPVFEGEWKKVENEIKSISKLCDEIPLKVIIETAYLNQNQIAECSKCCDFGGAAFVKTSTGFAPSGAKEEDILNIKKHCGHLGIKASGGIKSYKEAEKLIKAGASRIGSSASVSMIEEWKALSSL
jgi:deoxyribose-phosphate aldolase